jgi:plasmid maintenance system antidote protein VapI
MSISSKYKVLLAKTRKSLAFWSQIAKRDFTEELLSWMSQRSVNQTRLAKLVGVSPQFVTKLLRTNANVTIETMTKFAMALGCQVRIHLADQNATTSWQDRPADITRFTVPLAKNVIAIDRAKIRTIAHGNAPERPQVVNG